MSNEKVSIPEKLVLGGVEYSTTTPELQDFIKSVRAVVASEEKQKVRSTINELRDKVEQLNKVNIDGNISLEGISEIIESQFAKVGDLVETKVKTIVEQQLSPLTADVTMRSKQQVQAHIAKVIADNKGKLFPDLVEGNTIDEVNASVERSKTLFAKHIANNPAVLSAYTGTTQQTSPPTSTEQTPPAPKQETPSIEVPKTSASINEVKTDVGKMGMSEFTKQREALKQQLEEQFGG